MGTPRKIGSRCRVRYRRRHCVDRKLLPRTRRSRRGSIAPRRHARPRHILRCIMVRRSACPIGRGDIARCARYVGTRIWRVASRLSGDCSYSSRTHGSRMAYSPHLVGRLSIHTRCRGKCHRRGMVANREPMAAVQRGLGIGAGRGWKLSRAGNALWRSTIPMTATLTSRWIRRRIESSGDAESMVRR